MQSVPGLLSGIVAQVTDQEHMSIVVGGVQILGGTANFL